jgi:thiol-disulfide isomerase/thioredoxin
MGTSAELLDARQRRRVCLVTALRLCQNANVMTALRSRLRFPIDAAPACARSLVVAVAFAWTSVAGALEPGVAAPAFTLPTAGGDTVALDRLRGRIVYVDFWASWCGPCKRSFPWMSELQQRYGGQGFAVVAINVDRKREDAERFLRQVPAGFTVAFDAAGTTPAAYGATSMPSSYLIDDKGNVVEIENGFRDDRKAALEARIRALVAAR